MQGTEIASPWFSAEVIAALSGGLLAGLISVGLSFLAHRREARERLAAWNREVQERCDAWDREVQERRQAWDRETNEKRESWGRDTREQREQWIRERLFDSYSDAIYYLVKLSASAVTRAKDEKDVRQHFSEAQRFLNLIRGYHSTAPDVAGQLGVHTKALEAAWNSKDDLAAPAERALDYVKKLFEADSRIQI